MIKMSRLWTCWGFPKWGWIRPQWRGDRRLGSLPVGWWKRSYELWEMRILTGCRSPSPLTLSLSDTASLSLSFRLKHTDTLSHSHRAQSISWLISVGGINQQTQGRLTGPWRFDDPAERLWYIWVVQRNPCRDLYFSIFPYEDDNVLVL